MRPEVAKLLQDMLDATKRIQHYVHDETRERFTTTSALRDAVHWNFCIIGEALSQLCKLDADTASRIREWKRIIRFRNQLIHGYGLIDPGVSWSIIHNKLPLLVEDLHRMLHNEPLDDHSS